MHGTWWNSARAVFAFVSLLVMAPLGCSSPAPFDFPESTPKVLSPDACAPGERLLEGGGCEPAGVPPEACGNGFEPDGQRGCNPILPAAACPPGQMAIPGEQTCHDVAPCGSGSYGDIPVEADTQFVDQAYAGNDSDGTQERPWRTIQRGITAVDPGAIVAIAAGSYPEAVLVMGKPVRLWGRCPGKVEVELLDTQWFGPAIQIRDAAASGSEVRGIAATGLGRGVEVRGASSVVIDGVWAHDTGDAGIVIDSADGSASAIISRSLVEQSHFSGVWGFNASVTIEASAVRDTQFKAEGTYRGGIAIDGAIDGGARGRVTLRGSVVERNRGLGVLIEASDAEIENTVVRDTLPNAAGNFGRGIEVRDESTMFVVGRMRQRGSMTLRGSVLERNRDACVGIYGSDATIENTVVRDTQPRDAGDFGRGINVQGSFRDGWRGSMTLLGSVVERSRDVGVFVSGSDATIESTVVRDTQPRNAGDFGRGISLRNAPGFPERGRMTVRSSVVERNFNVAMAITASDVTIETTVVRDTRQSASGSLLLADGISVLELSTAVIKASQVTSNTRAGLLFVDSTGTLSDVKALKNRFGLVVQGSQKPTLGEGNVFESNTEQDKVIGGDLAVPNTPMPIP